MFVCGSSSCRKNHLVVAFRDWVDMHGDLDDDDVYEGGDVITFRFVLKSCLVDKKPVVRDYSSL